MEGLAEEQAWDLVEELALELAEVPVLGLVVEQGWDLVEGQV